MFSLEGILSRLPPKAREFVSKQGRFSIANTVSVPISFGMLFALTSGLHVLYLLSNLVAFLVATIINLWMNHVLKVVPFSGPREYAIKQAKFTGAKSLSFFLNEALLFVLVTLGHLWYIEAAAASLAVTTLVSFQVLAAWKVIPFSLSGQQPAKG